MISSEVSSLSTSMGDAASDEVPGVPGSSSSSVGTDAKRPTCSKPSVKASRPMSLLRRATIGLKRSRCVMILSKDHICKINHENVVRHRLMISHVIFHIPRILHHDWSKWGHMTTDRLHFLMIIVIASKLSHK